MHALSPLWPNSKATVHAHVIAMLLKVHTAWQITVPAWRENPGLHESCVRRPQGMVYLRRLPID